MDIYVIIGNIGYFITFLDLSYMSDCKWDACDSPSLNHVFVCLQIGKHLSDIIN